MKEAIKIGCQGCMFFESFGKTMLGAEKKGVCRRFPPKFVGNGLAGPQFPPVQPTDWCGEFQKKD